jgi:hypothetical protein
MAGTKKVGKKNEKSQSTQENAVYLSEEVKNYSFSDFVKLRSFPQGMLFSFGKRHPDSQNPVIFHEILLPFDVAVRLGAIIGGQLERLKEEGLIEIRPVDSGGSHKEKK